MALRKRIEKDRREQPCWFNITPELNKNHIIIIKYIGNSNINNSIVYYQLKLADSSCTCTGMEFVPSGAVCPQTGHGKYWSAN